MVLQTSFCRTLFSLVILASSDVCSGLSYRVGDSLWSVPPYPDFYSSWSSSHAFYVGDSLVFDFDSEFFNVVQVPRLDYDSCNTLSPVKFLNVGPATVTFDEAGLFYYICNISNYCNLGQKVSIVVNKQYPRHHPPSASPPPSSPSPTKPPLPVAPPLAPEPSLGGWTSVSQVPPPGNSQAPSIVINSNPINAPAGDERSSGVGSGGIVFSWSSAFCLCIFLCSL